MTVAVSTQGASQQGERRHDKYDRLVAIAQSLPKLKVAVAHPCDSGILERCVRGGWARPD